MVGRLVGPARVAQQLGCHTELDGNASLQFLNTCTVRADTIALGVEVLDTASRIVGDVAEKLRAAKKSAKLAVDDAQEADTRRDRAQEAMLDAQQEAQAARLRATFAQTTGVSSSFLLPNVGATAEETRALREAEAADQQAAAAQRSRDLAQGDVEDAQRAGDSAEREYKEAADDAARQIAALLYLTPQFIGPTGAAAAATGGPGAPEALVPFSTRPGALRPATRKPMTTPGVSGTRSGISAAGTMPKRR